MQGRKRFDHSGGQPKHHILRLLTTSAWRLGASRELEQMRTFLCHWQVKLLTHFTHYGIFLLIILLIDVCWNMTLRYIKIAILHQTSTTSMSPPLCDDFWQYIVSSSGYVGGKKISCRVTLGALHLAKLNCSTRGMHHEIWQNHWNIV